MPANKTSSEAGRAEVPWLKYVEVFSWIATAVGIFLALAQLTVATLDRRTDAALAYAEAFSSTEHLGEYRRTLTRAYLRHAQEIAMFRGAAVGKGVDWDDAVREFVYSTILLGQTSTESENLKLAVLEIADMYDQIQLCVTRKPLQFMGPRCNRDVIGAYFCDYAVAFNDLYQGVLKDISTEFGGEFGTGVRAIAEGDICAH